MTREEAIKILASSCIPGSKQTEALETLIPELRESEDERIRKALIEVFKKKLERGFEWVEYGIPNRSVLDWLEKQKENNEYVFRPLAGTDITIAAEQAIRRANEGDRLVLAFNGAYIPVREGCNANKIVDIYDAFIEKQKEANKAIEAVERIDKYIDENVANAHDMKNSNPDKKYYRGWDDALGAMAGILEDVYSGEKQKEQKPVEKHDMVAQLREHLANTPKEQLEAEWKELEKWNDVGPTVEEYLGGIKPAEYIKRNSKEWYSLLAEQYDKGFWKGKAEQKPAEWSEEDENCIRNLESVIYYDKNLPTDTRIKLGDFLKSLRPSWKPSEEQMEALQIAAMESKTDFNTLTSLLADLMKL